MNNIVYPDYNHCILNLITSILKYYKVKTKHSSLKELDEKLNNKNYTNIVFIILDGLGHHILNNTSKNNFFQKNQIDCITSVYPSTTTAALTTYYSGKPPYETGWIAWSQYFKEYGRALDMLPHEESYQKDSLKNVSMDVFKTLVNYTPIYEQIEKASPNVKAYEIMPNYSDRRSKRTIKADNISEICESITSLCKNTERKFVLAYSDNPDGLLHKYGCNSNEVKEFVLNTEKQIETMVKDLPDDTLVIISADHGHKDINKAYTLLDYPEILDCLIMPPSLESRVLAFWVKDDKKELFEKLFNNEFKDKFLLMKTDEFLNKNMLGFGEKHKKIDDFIGNYIALSISDSIINIETYLNGGKPIKKSTHCGLTKDEMEVPLIVVQTT